MHSTTGISRIYGKSYVVAKKGVRHMAKNLMGYCPTDGMKINDEKKQGGQHGGI